MVQAARNPLPAGLYRLELPADAAGVFGRWRRANSERVHVVGLEATDKGARVTFAVYRPPGAFPFGQLGQPETARPVVGATISWVDAVHFALAPLQAVEFAAAAAAAEFAASLVQPELAGLRDAVAAARVNVASIRLMLAAVADGTSPNPAGTLGAAASLAESSIEMLLSAGAAIPIAFPRAGVNKVLEELHKLATAIKAAPGKALQAVSTFAKETAKTVANVVVPFELGVVGVSALALGAFFLVSGKGRTQTTDFLMLGGLAVAVLGGTATWSNATAASH
jgi:hypothetical protein